jgi:hypothetical protein
MEELKKKAKSRGLWNLWMSKRSYPEGVDLTNLEVSCSSGPSRECLSRY